MELITRNIGASIIELTIKGHGDTTITEDITDLNSMVDLGFIQNLRSIADELEEHNHKVENI